MGNGCGDGGEVERIFVSVRVRPLISQEIEKNDHSKWEIINNTTIIFKNSLPDRSMMLPCSYSFDRVFGHNSDTRQVYEEGTKEVALSVVNGINSSIFAYGQTSSGKTYTMKGITEYTVEDIYDFIQKNEERDFILKFSAMEIYNEGVSDLLSSDSAPLRLLDDPERGTVVEKLTEIKLRDKSHLEELLAICEDQRRIGETSLNEASSRSHQILRLAIESSGRHFHGGDDSNFLSATVSFVDLAGSERASQTLSVGTKLKEGSHINRSLLTLGTVIRKLSKGRAGAHIPYRDSKLTRILQKSLGGNARTAIICTLSPARIHDEQSKNTLQFASCAKEVATSAKVNLVISDRALVKHLQREVGRLEDELSHLTLAHSSSHLHELKEKEAQIIKMKKEMREMIHQRDLALSRLHDLLSLVGDDQLSQLSEESSQLSVQVGSKEQAFRQWVVGHQPAASEDESSISEASSICYQSPDFFGLSKCRRVSIPEPCQNFPRSLQTGLVDPLDYDSNHPPPPAEATKSENSASDARCAPPNTRQTPTIARSRSGSSEDRCKEVRCVEIDDLKEKMDESSLLPVTFVAKLKTDFEPSLEEGNGVLALQNQAKMRQIIDNLRVLRASGLSTKSFCVGEDKEQNRAENTSTGSSSVSFGTEAEVSSGITPKKEISYGGELKVEENAITGGDELKERCSKAAYETAIPNISSFVEEVEEVPQAQLEKQVSHNQEMHQNPNKKYKMEEIKKNASTEILLSSSNSPSKWPLEFKKQQREIIELWDICNVSLIHRTYFFILFNGDPADSIYMEVEHRRLNFLKTSLFQGNETEAVTFRIKNLRRERAMLRRRIQKKLCSEERKNLYTKWDIKVSSKQRAKQVSELLWTDTKKMEYVRESALLVAKLFGLLKPEPALKEMFGLSFVPRELRRRSFSWNLFFSFR